MLLSNSEKAAEGDEARIISLISAIDGVDDVSVLINRSRDRAVGAFTSSSSDTEDVSGIAVAAKGADSPKIKQKIIELLCAAYSLPSNRIYVCGK